MAELGQVEKPYSRDFIGKRKLYCVPNIYPVKEAPDEYKKLVETYWQEAKGQIAKLEAAGKVKKIFCENIVGEGEEALNMLGRINEYAHDIVREKTEEGAALLPLENEEIFGPFLDWSNCLHVVRSKEVVSKVLEFYTEASSKRSKHILDVIEKNLTGGEAGLLIMADEDRVKLQFPPDIEVFLVTPRSYDDILKWYREKQQEK